MRSDRFEAKRKTCRGDGSCRGARQADAADYRYDTEAAWCGWPGRRFWIGAWTVWRRPECPKRSSTSTISLNRLSRMWPVARSRLFRSLTKSVELLDSGGGVAKALAQLGREPFFIINADTFWIDRSGSNLDKLAHAWDPSRMDMLLMLADLDSATGHNGKSDFLRHVRWPAFSFGRLAAGLDLCRRRHPPPAHLSSPAGWRPFAQPLFRSGDRNWPVVRHGDGGALDNRRHSGRHSTRRGDGREGAC